LIVAVAALVAGWAVVYTTPVRSFAEVQAVLLLAGLGLAADLLHFEHTRGATGSIAIIPYASAAIVSPNWSAVAAIAIAGCVTQVVCRRHSLKGVFNVAQTVLGLSLGVLVYRATGAPSVMETAGLSLLAAARSTLLPTIFLSVSLTLVNSATVSGVVAITQQRRVLEVWRATTIPTAPYFILTTVFSFYLAWLYASLGPIGAAGLVIPLVGVRQLYRTTLELTKVTEELLDLMVAAIEARDPYTSGHSQRVSRASKIIARAIGLKPAEVERVGVAALLHDVGKIDEAFAPILAKEGRLTPDEWAVMKRHPIRSAELVGLLTSLRDVVAPVRHHHENWDGTGYPDGLKGAAIPLASRIIMFADTLDAMTTDRPYRKALGMDEARAEFQRFRGRQFDPDICDRILGDEVWSELYASYTAPENADRSYKAG
jgi:HD-GYP domain-containing protein (c-di-GMP phosphodiesterase class II)